MSNKKETGRQRQGQKQTIVVRHYWKNKPGKCFESYKRFFSMFKRNPARYPDYSNNRKRDV
jgi:hypothetical protein